MVCVCPHFLFKTAIDLFFQWLASFNWNWLLKLLMVISGCSTLGSMDNLNWSFMRFSTNANKNHRQDHISDLADNLRTPRTLLLEERLSRCAETLISGHPDSIGLQNKQLGAFANYNPQKLPSIWWAFPFGSHTQYQRTSCFHRRIWLAQALCRWIRNSFRRCRRQELTTPSIP